MAYTKTVWKDRNIQRPNTFQLQNNPDGTITLIPKPGTVTEIGTPVNAVNLNNIEQGVSDAHDDLNVCIRKDGLKLTYDDGNITEGTYKKESINTSAQGGSINTPSAYGQTWFFTGDTTDRSFMIFKTKNENPNLYIRGVGGDLKPVGSWNKLIMDIDLVTEVTNITITSDYFTSGSAGMNYVVYNKATGMCEINVFVVRASNVAGLNWYDIGFTSPYKPSKTIYFTGIRELSTDGKIEEIIKCRITSDGRVWFLLANAVSGATQYKMHCCFYAV